jgi:hypothetical protein
LRFANESTIAVGSGLNDLGCGYAALCHYFFGLRKNSQRNRRKENGGKEDIVHLLFHHFRF